MIRKCDASGVGVGGVISQAGCHIAFKVRNLMMLSKVINLNLMMQGKSDQLTSKSCMQFFVH